MKKSDGAREAGAKFRDLVTRLRASALLTENEIVLLALVTAQMGNILYELFESKAIDDKESRQRFKMLKDQYVAVFGGLPYCLIHNDRTVLEATKERYDRDH